jgi:type VI secretion system secreted protein Hcp
MTRAVSSIIIVLATLVVASALPLAAAGAFVKIDGVPGESTDKDHQGWIEVQSFSHPSARFDLTTGQSTMPTRSGSHEAGEIAIVKSYDSASASLFQSCVEGENIPTVRVELCGEGEGKGNCARYVLNDVTVTAVGLKRTGKKAAPTEQVTLAYDRILWSYEGAPSDPAKSMSLQRKTRK